MNTIWNESFDLELKDVSKHFGKVIAAESINLTVKKGEFLSLLGPSGCGKTTILRMIAGFEEPSSGEIFIKGECVNDIPSFERHVGLVFQSYALFPHLNVEENLAFGLKIRKMDRSLIKERVEKMLNLVRLPGKNERYPSQLSGGEQQRIALARALIIEPDLLLLDEPLSNLDAKLRVEMRIELKRIQEQVGITTIFVTHDQEEALIMSDRIVVMNRGDIEQMGTPTEIYENPKREFVARFIGEGNFFDGVVENIHEKQAVVKTNDGQTMAVENKEGLRIGNSVKVFIRPENINVVSGIEGQGENCFETFVTFTSYLGSTCRYVCRLANSQKEVLICMNNERGIKPLQIGTSIFVSWRPQNCVVYEIKDH